MPGERRQEESEIKLSRGGSEGSTVGSLLAERSPGIALCFFRLIR